MGVGKGMWFPRLRCQDFVFVCVAQRAGSPVAMYIDGHCGSNPTLRQLEEGGIEVGVVMWKL